MRKYKQAGYSWWDVSKIVKKTEYATKKHFSRQKISIHDFSQVVLEIHNLLQKMEEKDKNKQNVTNVSSKSSDKNSL